MNLELGQSYHNPETNNEVEFYWVKPIFTKGDVFSPFKAWQHRQRLNEEIAKWVVDTYGGSTDWSVFNRRWAAADEKYYFRDEADRTLFMLRWG